MSVYVFGGVGWRRDNCGWGRRTHGTQWPPVGGERGGSLRGEKDQSREKMGSLRLRVQHTIPWSLFFEGTSFCQNFYIQLYQGRPSKWV